MKVIKFIKRFFKNKHDDVIYILNGKTVWECKKCGRKMIIG